MHKLLQLYFDSLDHCYNGLTVGIVLTSNSLIWYLACRTHSRTWTMSHSAKLHNQHLMSPLPSLARADPITSTLQTRMLLSRHSRLSSKANAVRPSSAMLCARYSVARNIRKKQLVRAQLMRCTPTCLSLVMEYSRNDSTEKQVFFMSSVHSLGWSRNTLPFTEHGGMP